MYVNIYILDTQQLVKERKLFPCLYQINRHTKVISEIIKYHEYVENLGLHSVQKGAVNFVWTGSTVGPSIVVVFLMAGWKISGAKDMYNQFD